MVNNDLLCGGRKAILLVEDDDELRQLLEQTLLDRGYAVISAADGKAALKLYARGGFDLVIADILMPEMDGLELVGALRKLNPEVRIIAMSGGGMVSGAQYLTTARLLGCAGILAKPFKLEKLMEMLEQQLR